MSVDILDRVYDAYTGEMGQQFMRETQRRIHWMCCSVHGDSVLDVGCSQGLVPILLGREGKQVIGIDTSPAAIRTADERLLTEQLEVRRRVAFIEGDFVAHAFQGPQFDCIVMGEVLEHLLDPARFIETAARLLQPGGRLVVTVPFGINDHVDHKHTFYLLEPLRLLAPHFELVDVTILGRWLGVVARRRAESSSEASTAWSEQQIRALEVAFNHIERELVDELTGVRAKLDDANTKYRSSNEELSRLKREVAHHESERKSAERARGQLETQLTQAVSHAPTGDLAKELSELRAAVSSERDTSHARQLEVVRFEERLNQAGQVRALELEVRDREIARLVNARDEALQQLQKLEAELTRVAEQARTDSQRHQSDVARLDRELEAQVRQTRASADQSDALRRELDRQAEQLATAERAFWVKAELLEETLKRERAEANRLRAEAEKARSIVIAREGELADAAARLRQLEETIAVHKRQVSEREAAQRQAEQEAATLKQARRALDVEAEKQLTQRRDLERRAERAEQQLKSVTQAERRLTQKLEQERRNRTSAERRVVQTKNTLSFKLGYELIHGFKSKERLRSLPGALWELQREATRRRSDRTLRELAPLSATAEAEAPDAPMLSRAPAIAPVARVPAVSPPPRFPESTPSLRSESPMRPSLETVPEAPASKPQPAAHRPNLDAGVAGLRVACIHDEFTFASYAPECNLFPLTPADFRRELEDFNPELLFVESAWRGKDDLWGKKISHRAHELLEIVEWCRARGVPTVFWNKEDPVHFGTFVNTAKLFDYVFTTDFDCIGRYKQALGHEHVYLLPFACQPAQHNPLEKYERKDAICFAGAYYARYPERQQDLASFALNFTDAPRLEIFDRNHGKNDPNYAFPEEYRSFIVGTLRFEEIDRAYKGYRYALNLNSIKESQTMFARRLYELLGSNTITVSNFSRGVRLLFGDLVITTDRGERARARLLDLTRDEHRARRFRLAGLRKVLSEHTYADRLRFIASQVWEQTLPDPLPRITVLGLANSSTALLALIASFERQSYANKELVVVTTPAAGLAPATAKNVRQIPLEKAAGRRLSDVMTGSHVASLSSNDHHGRNYLLDLALTTKYSKAAAIGKRAHYAAVPGGVPVLQHDGAQYRSSASLPIRASLIRKDLVGSRLLVEWLESILERQLEHSDCLAIDEFNYCKDGAQLAPELLTTIDDLMGLDEGISLAELVKRTPGPAHAPRALPQQRVISAELLASIFKVPAGKAMALSLENGALSIESALADETHEYLYANQTWKLAELGLPQSDKFRLEASPGLNLHMTLLFLDQNKQRLGHKLCPAGRNEIATPPEGSAYVQLGLRVYGSGSAKISGFVLGHVAETPERIFGRAEYLLLTNHYPADQDLYRNGFVHRRVTDYIRRGTRVDVFRHRTGEKLGHREFDGVDVISGGSDALSSLLRSNRYKAILVHFLDPAMWQVIRQEARTARPLLWLHGAEIQAWHRRDFNEGTDVERETAKAKSEQRDVFWRRVLDELPDNGKLIFVSRQFAEQTLGDLGLPREHRHCTVIHNLIDDALFQYHPKSPEQRTRVLSIRPFMSRKYANDLSVAAILELAKKPYFDQFSFHIVGDGPLFDATVAPLRGFANVQLDKGFVTQQEIAQLHRDYGVFLCPTRDDTQGVSRDEAMASGLVPLTTRVAAVPEFVDDDCAMLAEPESHSGLAESMARLYEDPALFARLSEQAAARVRRQSGPEQTTARELALILERTS